MLLEIEIRRHRGNDDIPLPAYQTELAVGMDLHAAITDAFYLEPLHVTAIPCGFSMALPAGYQAEIRPRSGLAAKYSLTVVNSPGTIDPDYRGEVQVLLINHGKESVQITRGMRIAQMVVTPVPRVLWKEVETLPDTVRGSGGFGHTGV